MSWVPRWIDPEQVGTNIGISTTSFLTLKHRLSNREELAPTGSGKTPAAFMCAVDGLFKQGLEGELEDGIQVLYVSPLRVDASRRTLTLAASPRYQTRPSDLPVAYSSTVCGRQRIRRETMCHDTQ